jgi:hypothetical protein
MSQRAHNTVFWDMTPLNVVEIYISFGRTSSYSYIPQGRGLREFTDSLEEKPGFIY